MRKRRSKKPWRVEGIIRAWVRLFWFLFKWGIAPGTIAAIVALPYVYRQVDVEIRDKIRDRFAAHYSDLDVEVRSARLVEGCGIEVRGFKIRDPRLKGPAAVLVDLDQVLFCGATDLADLVACRFDCNRVTIQRPTFRMVRTVDGSWSFENLWPLPKFGDSSPDVYIENGIVELIDESKPTPSRWTLRDVNLSIVTRRDEITGELVRKMEGHLLGDYLDVVEFSGSQAMDSNDWSIIGSVAKVDISPEFHQALPGLSAKEAELYAGFRGRASLDFRLHSDPTQPKGFRFEVKGAIDRGRFDEARLPYPITDVRANFCASPKGFSITDLTAWFGRSVVSLTCYRAGYDEYSLWDIDGTIKNLQLEPRLVAGLPEKVKSGWRKFTPSGRVDAKVKLLTDGRSIRPEHCEVTVDCYDIATTYDKFPYAVEHGSGRLVLKDDVVKIQDQVVFKGPVLSIQNMEFKGQNDQPIWVEGKWGDPFKPNPIGWVQMKGLDIPLDKKLYDAVNESSKNTMRLLNLEGTTDCWARVERKSHTAEATQQFVMTLRDASICLETFPYPLKHIHGRAKRFPDKSWEFSDLTAVNGSSAISASGWLAKKGSDDQLLHFVINGNNIVLGDDLYKAISQKPAMGQAWQNIRPSGAVDVNTVLEWSDKEKKLDMTVTATPRGETVSIEPVSFPYRLEKIRGPMVFQNGKVTFDCFRGQHGSMTVAGKGGCEFLKDGSWELRLHDMEVSNLHLNRELIQACPPQLRKGLTNLQPKGPMYISRGAFTLNRSLDPTLPPKAAWNLTLGFQQSSLDCGAQLENVNGTMDLVGSFDGAHHRSKGELNIDSLTCKDFLFTEIRGPFWINDEVVWFGSPYYGKKPLRPNPKRPSVDNQQQDVRPLTYKFYGGNVISTGWVQAGDQLPLYAFGAYLEHGDLARFTRETSPGSQQVTGQFGAHVQLAGKGRTLNGLHGSGNLWLRNADIYELPVMVRLLKILGGSQPDETAFSKADIQFKIENCRMILSPIEFNGDAISLLGEGIMDFDSKIDLAFRAVVGRNDIWVPVFSAIADEASRQTMTIHVKGPLSDPNISRDVLPAVKEALSRLEKSMQAAPRTR